jgi:hypothetical protein
MLAMAQPGTSVDQLANTTLDEGLTYEMQSALEAIHRAEMACEWCAERCVDLGPEMAACLRLCRDVADIGSLTTRSIARDSPSAPGLASEFVAAAQACAQECSQHQHRHCQACAEELSRAIGATQQMLATIGQQGGQQRGFGHQGQQEQGGQIQQRGFGGQGQQQQY